MALSKRDIEMIFRAETDAAQRPVNELSADVKRLRQTLEDLSKTSNKTDKQLDDLASTTRDLQRAQEELGTARSLLTQLNAQASAVERAEAAVEKAGAKYQQLKTQVEGADAPTKRLTTSLAAAERGLAANNKRLDEARANYTEVKTSIESIIGPVDSLEDAFRTVAVAQRETTQALVAAKGATTEFRQEIAQTKLDAERLSQVDAFRKMAADSIASTSAMSRIRTETDGATTSAQRLADAVLGLVNPAQAAAKTLDGMEDRLTAALATLDNKKISMAEFGQVNNELQAVQASLIEVAGLVDKYSAAQQRVATSASAYDEQAQKVRALAAAEITASTNVEELTADLARNEKQLEALGTELARDTARLNEMGAALRRVGVDTNNLPQAIQRIETTAKRAAPAIKSVGDALSPGGRKGFLGLDPYQLQNLSFQINDVFTGLASGQPPMQVFAQQAGQIVQIFPGMISGFMAWLPLIAPVGAALFVLGSALAEANDQIKTLRTANTVLASLGNTNGYDTAKFVEVVNLFKEIGVSAEDATAATRIFVTEGLNPEAVNDYVIAARNLAEVQGIEIPQATEELTKAFTRGAEEVLALDDRYHFLTETQRENLIASKDTEREYDEVNRAFTALYNKMQDGAEASRGPMADAADTLRTAWRALLAAFADTGVVDAVVSTIANATLGLTYLINLARRVGALFQGVGTAINTYGPIGAGIAVANNLYRNGNPLADARQDTFAQMRTARTAVDREQQAVGADAGRGSAGRQREREQQAARDRRQGARDAARAAREAEAEAARRAREAAALERQYGNESDQLTAALSRATAQAMRGTQAPLAQQLELARQSVDEQFTALEDRLAEFREKFGDRPINGMSQADYAAALEAQKQQLVQIRQLGVYESNVNDLLQSRSERLREIREQQDAGLISAQDALDQTREVTSELGPQIDTAIEAARQFIAALQPSAETQALLDKFARIQTQSSGPEASQTIVRQQADAGRQVEEQRLNDLFERRSALIEAANNLYEMGAINFTEKEQRIQAAFAMTNDQIVAQIALLREFLIANQALFPPEVFDRAIAQLDAYGTQLRYVDSMTQAVKASAEQAIADGVMTMFNSLAQGIANVITGAGGLKSLFADLGRAALNFAAQFTQAIAQAIMQMYALRIAKSLVGGFHGGGTVGDYGGGQMKLSRSLGFPDLNLSAVPRYHNGTQGAGLKSNEMLAVLEKGEKVTTKEQQRLEAKRLKAAESGGGKSLRQVLAFGDEQVAAAMQGPEGERTFVTFLRRNVPLLKQMIS